MKEQLGGGTLEALLATKNVLTIYYQWWAGKCNMRFYTGEMNGEIIDYNTIDSLKETATKYNVPYQVLRVHRKPSKYECTILDHNIF